MLGVKGFDPLDLLLFVRGCGARSLDAIRAVRRACDASDAAPHSLRIIDVFNEPGLVEKYRVIATPTLVTLGGSHERRLVGNVSEQGVRAHFELGARPTTA
jgi:circadian clock protein KaiB